MKNRVCYLDLDGVLVDFVGGALKAHGKTMDRATIPWDFNDVLGLSGNAFWAPCGFDFWASLDWTCEGRELLAALESLFGERIAILTKPCLTQGAVEGKVAWIESHLPAYRRRFFVGGDKHLLASPNKILIDDNTENIQQFSAGGGNAVLVPRSWNARKDEIDAEGCFSVSRIVAEVHAILDGK